MMLPARRLLALAPGDETPNAALLRGDVDAAGAVLAEGAQGRDVETELAALAGLLGPRPEREQPARAVVAEEVAPHDLPPRDPREPRVTDDVAADHRAAGSVPVGID